MNVYVMLHCGVIWLSTHHSLGITLLDLFYFIFTAVDNVRSSLGCTGYSSEKRSICSVSFVLITCRYDYQDSFCLEFNW